MNEALRSTIGTTLSNIRRCAALNQPLMSEVYTQIHSIFSNLPEALSLMGWTQDAIRAQLKIWAKSYVEAKAITNLHELPEVKKLLSNMLVSIQKSLEN